MEPSPQPPLIPIPKSYFPGGTEGTGLRLTLTAPTPAASNLYLQYVIAGLPGLSILSKPIKILNHEEKTLRRKALLIHMAMTSGNSSN